MRRLLPPLIALLAALPLLAAAPCPPDGYAERLRAQALIATLNSELLSHDSATATLQHWCDLRRLAPGQSIAAHRETGEARAPDAATLTTLGAQPGEAVAYRRVALACGDHVLSIADNWYRPGRLTPEMNRQLAETTTPFGVVVRPLGFARRTLAVQVLFNPLPPGWEADATRDFTPSLSIPTEVLRHRAVLTDSTGVPFSVVIETYTRDTVAD